MGFSLSDIRSMTREDRLAYFDLYKKEVEMRKEIRENAQKESK